MLHSCHALTLVNFDFFIILVMLGCDEGGMCVLGLFRVFVHLWGFGLSRYIKVYIGLNWFPISGSCLSLSLIGDLI